MGSASTKHAAIAAHTQPQASRGSPGHSALSHAVTAPPAYVTAICAMTGPVMILRQKRGVVSKQRAQGSFSGTGPCAHVHVAGAVGHRGQHLRRQHRRRALHHPLRQPEPRRLRREPAQSPAGVGQNCGRAAHDEQGRGEGGAERQGRQAGGADHEAAAHHHPCQSRQNQPCPPKRNSISWSSLEPRYVGPASTPAGSAATVEASITTVRNTALADSAVSATSQWKT